MNTKDNNDFIYFNEEWNNWDNLGDSNLKYLVIENNWKDSPIFKLKHDN